MTGTIVFSGQVKGSKYCAFQGLLFKIGILLMFYWRYFDKVWDSSNMEFKTTYKASVTRNQDCTRVGLQATVKGCALELLPLSGSNSGTMLMSHDLMIVDLGIETGITISNTSKVTNIITVFIRWSRDFSKPHYKSALRISPIPLDCFCHLCVCPC